MAGYADKSKKDKIDFKYNLKVYWSFLRKYKLLFFLAALVALINEALNLTEKLLFKVIVDRGTDFGDKTITVEIFTSILILLAIIYLASVVVKAFAKWISLHLINKLEANLIKDLKQRFFNHIITLSHSFHVSHKTGSLIARIGRGAGGIERMTDFIVFNIFPLIFQLVLIGVSLIYFDWQSTIIIISTLGLFVGYSLYMQGIQKRENERLNKAEDIEKANLADIMTNIDSIKYYGKENAIKQKYGVLISNSKKSLRKYWDYFRWMDSGQNVILWLGTLALIYFSVKDYLEGRITLGTVVLIYTVYGSLFGNIYGFIHGVRNYYRSMMDFHDLFQYAKIEQEVKDMPEAKKMKIEEGKIEFKSIDFKYNTKKIFEKFSLKIKPGEKVALVGHSGSGKSTLVKLLYRFYEVNKGEILIDGRNIKEFEQESLRSELSIVPQECVLFDDTIFNNILFSRPDATRQEVLKAIKFAQLDKTIRNFPNKEKTVVGERGVKLSGGEKQRVSIARALLANRKIIVLDEATSSLDSQTEHEIQRDLQQLLNGRTSIIIAHRLSTIMGADKIVVIDKGKIVQTGTHNELINNPGVYKKLWSLQKGGYIGE